MESWQEVNSYYILYAGTAAMLILSTGMLLIFRAYHKRLMRQQNEKSELEIKYRDDLLSGNIRATEEERARIARDLHDEVGASLSLLRMQVRSLPVAELAETRMAIDETLDMVRRISHHLQPPALEAFGLVVALQQYCEQLTQHSGISISLDNYDEDIRLDSLTELSVFRVIQELVQNTLKHADATEVSIELQYDKGILNVSYTDNGKGYDYSKMQKESGLGLKNIEIRMRQCNGKVEYSSMQDGTVRVTITTPANS